MKFYPEYKDIESTDTNKGTIHCKRGNSFAFVQLEGEKTNSFVYIPDLIAINRAIDGNTVIIGDIHDINYSSMEIDSVYLPTDAVLLGYSNIVNVLDWNKNTSGGIVLTGVLYINSKVLYGINKRGMPLYLFKPDSNKYPPLHVASSYKKKNKDVNYNLYSKICIKEWKITNKYPIGTCIENIGRIGDRNVEFDYILQKYGLKYSERLYREYKLSTDETSKDDFNDIRIDFRDKYVVSIDPNGCRDIDDALHCCKTGDDGGYEIGVHIADVTKYVTENSILDKEASKRLSSVYMRDKQISMLPPCITFDECSLHAGKDKYTMSVIYKVSKEGKITGYNVCKGLINSKHSLDYETVQTIFDGTTENTELRENLYLLNSAVCKLNINECHLIDNIEGKEAHNIVDYLMILTNKTIAEYLFSKMGHCILRTHQKTDIDKFKVLDGIHEDNMDLIKHMTVISSKSAKYQFFTDTEYSTEKGDMKHSALGLSQYTHFTSPIRRYIDVIIHRMINLVIRSDLDSNTDMISKEYERLCEQLNNKYKNIQKAERDFNKLYLIYDDSGINSDASSDTSREYTAYITNINRKGNITVYIPKLGITHKFRLYSNKMKAIFNFEFTESKDSHELETGLTLTNLTTGESTSLQLFDKIVLSLLIMTKKEQSDKFIAEIISPKIDF
jgi:exoribonuclease R